MDPNQTSRRQCPFCGRSPPEVEITREHVLAQWLGEALKTAEVTMSWKRWYRDEEGEEVDLSKQVPISPFEMQVKEVCRDCNNNVLGPRVEEPVMKLLPALAKGDHIVLHPENQRRLALWAAKTAATRALMDKGYRVIPQEHYRCIREHLAPPPETEIWVIDRIPSNTTTRHLSFIASLENPNPGHISAICMGGVGFVVVGFTRPLNNMVPGQIDMRIGEFLPDAAIRIWPTSESFDWPLRSKVDHSAIDRLCDELKSLIGIVATFPLRPLPEERAPEPDGSPKS